MLVVHSNAQVVVALDQAIQRLQLACHQLQQRGLAGTIGTHDGNTAVQVHTQVHTTAGAQPNNQQRQMTVINTRLAGSYLESVVFLMSIPKSLQAMHAVDTQDNPNTCQTRMHTAAAQLVLLMSLPLPIGMLSRCNAPG